MFFPFTNYRVIDLPNSATNSFLFTTTATSLLTYEWVNYTIPAGSADRDITISLNYPGLVPGELLVDILLDDFSSNSTVIKKTLTVPPGTSMYMNSGGFTTIDHRLHIMELPQ